MKFDANLAWKQATTLMAANRELVLALAGVFFFLPSFALIMLAKQPQVAQGATPEQMAAALQPYLATIIPFLLIGSIVQALGQLTLLELFGRGGQATVGQAVRKGFGKLLSYIALQLMTGLMTSSVLLAATMLGSLVTPLLGVALGIYAVCQLYGRYATASSVIVLEGQRNPFTALVRAVSLSRGNGFRLGNFLFLLALAVFLIFIVLTILVGIVAALAFGEGRASQILTGFVSSATTAFAVSYFAAITIAIYRQLLEIAPEED